LDTLRFEIFQKGNRLSNECLCYFYYEITLKNKRYIPKYIFIGKEEFEVDLRETISKEKLKEIKNRINKKLN
jgi:hypothetical protein